MDFNFNVNAHVHYAHGELKEVRCLLEDLMSKISEYIEKQKAFNESLSNDISGIASSLTAIDGDVAALNQKIADLTVTPEEQASLDSLVADGQALAARTKAAATAAAALDDKTPPVAPPVT